MFLFNFLKGKYEFKDLKNNQENFEVKFAKLSKILILKIKEKWLVSLIKFKNTKMNETTKILFNERGCEWEVLDFTD